jgi:chaperone BCS1
MMTTNHRDKLDEALIRPGRCDVQVEFANADESQKRRLFERFFPGSKYAQDFRATGDYSMAELQKHMMLYRNNSQQAFENPIEKDSHE